MFLNHYNDHSEIAPADGDCSHEIKRRLLLGEGNGNPLQYSCLENSMDRGAWQATVHGLAKSRTQLSNSYLLAHM